MERITLARNIARQLFSVDVQMDLGDEVSFYRLLFKLPGESLGHDIRINSSQWAVERLKEQMTERLASVICGAIDTSHQQCPAPTPIGETKLSDAVAELKALSDQKQWAKDLLKHLEFLNLILNGEEAAALKDVYYKAYEEGRNSLDPS